MEAELAAAALTQSGTSSENNTAEYAKAASEAAASLAAALSDSGPSSSAIGDVKFGDMSNVSGGGGLGLSNKKLMMIGGFVLGGMLIYGLTMGKGRR